MWGRVLIRMDYETGVFDPCKNCLLTKRSRPTPTQPGSGFFRVSFLEFHEQSVDWDLFIRPSLVLYQTVEVGASAFRSAPDRRTVRLIVTTACRIDTAADPAEVRKRT